jgi:23S rRNA pseudouridine2605 synthase
MAVGMVIDDRKTAPAGVKVISQESGRVVLEVVLYEGRNRQIRKMCEQLGLEVARLKRVAVGPLKLGMLQPGKWRTLTAEEVRRLTAGAKADKQSETEARNEDHRTAPKRKYGKRPSAQDKTRRGR